MTDSAAWLEAARLAAVAKVEHLFANPAEIGAFMTARLDEDETAAQQAAAGPWWNESGYLYREGPDNFGEVWILPPHPNEYAKDAATAEHIARHDPTRVMAEVAIKRDRLNRYLEYRKTLRDVYAHPSKYTFDQQLVAGIAAGLYEVLVRTDLTVYDQHPGFKPEWRLP